MTIKSKLGLIALGITLSACSAITGMDQTARRLPEKPPVAQARPEPKPVGETQYIAAEFKDLPGWAAEDFGEALSVLQYTCAKGTIPSGNVGQEIFGDKDTWRALCNRANIATKTGAREFFEKNFKPYRVQYMGKANGLFTGYYEAELRGSLKRNGRYRYPIYRLPPQGDLQLTRAEIDRGALVGKNLELAWVDDPVALYALHIQGSGRVKLDSGEILRIGFAGKNVHPYTSIGKTFGDWNLLPKDQIHMATIETWFKQHPDMMPQVLQTNDSYIFFRPITGDGPIGAMGLALRPLRSLAVDRAVYPLGLPFWLDTPHPVEGSAPLRRMMFAHDTGTAIKGSIRGDVFWGAGEKAKQNAGLMRSRGGYYVLAPQNKILISGNDARR